MLVVGVIVRAHGIRGEVLVDVRTDQPAERFAPGAVLNTDPGGGAGTLTVAAARPHQGRLIVAFEGLADRGEAEELRGVNLCVDAGDLPPPSDPDEFNDHQLIGLRAVTPQGEALGDVVRVEHAPASDLLVLRRLDGGTALVPFVKAIVPEVDLAGGRVVLTPPGGLLDL
ncbi:MAG: ribosome maturation factor RimM [Micromonosporaceae bacterium]